MRWIAVGLLMMALSACKGIANMPDIRVVKPELTFKDLRVKAIDFQGIDTRFVLRVQNPYPVKLKVASNDWKLKLAGEDFLDGTGGKLDIEARQSSPVRIPVAMQWADMFRVAGSLKGKDEIPFVLRTTMGFDTPLGRVQVPLRHQGTLPALHKPRISLKGIRVEGLNLATQTARLALDVGVASDQGAAIGFDAFDYRIRFNGANVVNGQTSMANIGDEGTLTVPISLKLLNLGAGIVRAVKNKGTLDVGLAADIDVATPFGIVPLQVDRSKNMQLR